MTDIMKKTIYTSLCSILMIVGLTAQEKKTKKASKEFENFAYANAIDSYKDLVNKGYSEEDIYKNLGNANYLNANYEAAAQWFSKLFDLENTEIEADYYYRYAQTLKSLQDYKRSDAWMEKFVLNSDSDARAKTFTNNRNYIEEIEKNSGRYKVKLASFNSENSDFAPSFYKDGLIFSSSRGKSFNKNGIHKWNNQPFLNLYTATKGSGDNFNVNKIEKKINSKAHESSTAITNDGKTIYFTRNNFNNGFGRDSEGVSRLKLFRATIDGEQWKNVEEMTFNSKEYSVAHPTLNKDNTKLFFASDMPGTFGSSDIFYVDLGENGSYSNPINLGADINTEGRETFPFIGADDILYFSSDGRPGLGGLDIFAANLIEETNSIIEIINLGKPINTDEDDFSFIVDKTGKSGYFASNRSNGVGDDDIYSFTIENPLTFGCNRMINGIVKDKETGEILANADVQILSNSGEVVVKTISDANGKFKEVVDCNSQKLTAIGVKADYREDKLSFVADDSEKVVELFLTPSASNTDLGNDLANYLDIPLIYFDFNQSFIRPDAALELQKVISYMEQYPNVEIAIGSHTDSRGSDTYNLSLSDRRAKATRNYIISKGINSSRLTAKGYGETVHVNRCENGVKCSESEHDLNRRSEFIITKR